MYLYAIKCSETQHIKIGYSEDPDARCRSLQTGNSGNLQVLHRVRLERTDRARLIEKKLHQELGHHRVRGEWFNITETRARGMLDYAIIRWEDDPLLDW